MQRLKPFGHRFVYRVFSLLVDLDRLDELDRMTPLFSVNRPNLARSMKATTSSAPGETVRAFADRLLQAPACREPAARILLLAYPAHLRLRLQSDLGLFRL